MRSSGFTVSRHPWSLCSLCSRPNLNLSDNHLPFLHSLYYFALVICSPLPTSCLPLRAPSGRSSLSSPLCLLNAGGRSIKICHRRGQETCSAHLGQDVQPILKSVLLSLVINLSQKLFVGFRRQSCRSGAGEQSPARSSQTTAL